MDSEWLGAVHHAGVYDWSTPAHWSADVPESGDKAVFSGAGANAIPAASQFTVAVSRATETVGSLACTGGAFQVTVDLNQHRLLTETAGPTPVIGAGGADNVFVQVTGGTGGWNSASVKIRDIELQPDLMIQGGTLHVTDGTTLGVSTYFKIGNGAGSHGALLLDGGAKAATDRLYVGFYAGSTGVVALAGAGTYLRGNHEAYFGYLANSRGEATIGGGAQLSVGGSSRSIHLASAGDASASASVLITGANSFMDAGKFISIGTLGRATAVVEQGALLSAGQLVRVGTGSELTVRGGATAQSRYSGFQIDGGGRLTVDDGAVIVGSVSAGSNFTAQADSMIDMVLYDAERYAPIQVNGNVVIGLDVTLNLSLGPGAAFGVGDFVKLFAYSGTRTGTFANFTENQVFAIPGSNLRFQFAYAHQPDGDADAYIGLRVTPPLGTTITVR